VSIPSREEALKILKQSGTPPHIIDHCLLVTKIALRYAEAFKAKGYEVDTKLIEAGALLHDIGRSQSHGIEHGAVGGIILRKMGIAESIARIVERHVGAGLTEEEAKKNHLPDFGSCLHAGSADSAPLFSQEPVFFSRHRSRSRRPVRLSFPDPSAVLLPEWILIHLLGQALTSIRYDSRRGLCLGECRFSFLRLSHDPGHTPGNLLRLSRQVG